MKLNYCAKCNKLINREGYCVECRHLLHLNPHKLGDILEVPDNARLMNGDYIIPSPIEEPKDEPEELF